MSRGLAVFLAFLAAVLCAAGIGAWLIGPNLVRLAFDADTRGTPYYVVDFVAAPISASLQQQYVDPLRESIEHEGGALLGTAALEIAVEGGTDDEWATLALANFDRSSDVVQLLTSSRYREVAAGVPEPGLLLGTVDAPAHVGSGSWVVFLLESRPGAADPMRELVADAAEDGGLLVWDANVEVLRGGARWDRLVALEFDTPAAAGGWLHAERVRTARALLAARSRRVALLKFSVTPEGGARLSGTPDGAAS